jgi:hypothetical protein
VAVSVSWDAKVADPDLQTVTINTPWTASVTVISGRRRGLVCSGHYAFQRTPQEGAPQNDPARFSMTIVKRDGRWEIADHHSSLLPAQR